MLTGQKEYFLYVHLDVLLNTAFIKAHMLPTLCHSDFYLLFGT